MQLSRKKFKFSRNNPRISGCRTGTLGSLRGIKEEGMTDKLRDQIESAIAKAYEIGHNHAMNVYRMALGQKPKMQNIGWVVASDVIVKIVDRELKKCQKQSSRKK